MAHVKSNDMYYDAADNIITSTGNNLIVKAVVLQTRPINTLVLLQLYNNKAFSWVEHTVDEPTLKELQHKVLVLNTQVTNNCLIHWTSQDDQYTLFIRNKEAGTYTLSELSKLVELFNLIGIK